MPPRNTVNSSARRADEPNPEQDDLHASQDGARVAPEQVQEPDSSPRYVDAQPVPQLVTADALLQALNDQSLAQKSAMQAFIQNRQNALQAPQVQVQQLIQSNQQAAHQQFQDPMAAY